MEHFKLDISRPRFQPEDSHEYLVEAEFGRFKYHKTFWLKKDYKPEDVERFTSSILANILKVYNDWVEEQDRIDNKATTY